MHFLSRAHFWIIVDAHENKKVFERHYRVSERETGRRVAPVLI